MIYQHRLVIVRGGRLDKRHEAFQQEAMLALDDYGSALIGAWEVWLGVDDACAVYQLRQFESLASWEVHQQRVKDDRQLGDRRQQRLYPYNDFVDTSIVRMADQWSPLPSEWPSFEDVRGTERGFFEQRVIYLRPDRSAEHHEFYFDKVAPALESADSKLVALFDTVIGPGTTNAGSHRSIELRRFPDMSSWQRWREAQETDSELKRLVKQEWMARVERVESVLLRPLDYSRIR